jgi:hypothetical protein
MIFTPFSATRRADFHAITLGRCERGVDEAFRFIDLAFLAQRIRKIGEYLAQRFLATPLLEAPMHGLVVRVALREHVPLRASVENPQRGFQDSTCWNRFAAGTTVRNIFLRKVLANSLPLLIAQFQHARNLTALNAATE